MALGMQIVYGLLGGLGLFLLGMELMADGLQKVAGDRMRKILELFTAKPAAAVATGAFVTALIQSSATTTVMIVGFVNSGLMTLAQAAGTIMGANIGTTITAQIVSFDIYVFAFPLIGAGALLYFFARKKVHRHIGLGVLGFGLLLLGLSTISVSASPIRDYEPFLKLLVRLGQKPLLGIVMGIIFTALVQSSSATTGLVIAFASQGILSVSAGLALVVGANIGSVLPVVLASVGSSNTAKRATLIHVLFNVFGVLLFILLRRPFEALIALTATSVARQIANGHTLFNIMTTLILFPVLPYFIRFVASFVPGTDEVIELKPKYLADRFIQTPAAILQAQKEAVRMGKVALQMLDQSMQAFLTGKEQFLQQITQRETLVNSLEKEITTYLAKVVQESMHEKQARQVTNLMHVVNDLERMGDHAFNMAELAEAKANSGHQLSSDALADLAHMSEIVERIAREVLDAFAHDDLTQAKKLVHEDEMVDILEKEYRSKHIERLSTGHCQPEIGVLFLDMLSNLERIADHANNIAEAVVDLAFED